MTEQITPEKWCEKDNHGQNPREATISGDISVKQLATNETETQKKKTR